MRSRQLRPCRSPRFDGFAIGWSKRRDRKSNRPHETRPLIAPDSAARKCLLSVRSERVRQKPEAGAAGERVLDAGFSVAVKFTGNWALVCRDGVCPRMRF